MIWAYGGLGTAHLVEILYQKWKRLKIFVLKIEKLDLKILFWDWKRLCWNTTILIKYFGIQSTLKRIVDCSMKRSSFLEHLRKIFILSYSPTFMRLAYLFVFFFKGEFLLLDNFELVTEIEFSCFLLKLGEFVLVFGDLFQCRLHAREQ